MHFITTIQDSTQVKDLDTEKDAELNPEFSFGLDERVHDLVPKHRDQLEEILMRHGLGEEEEEEDFDGFESEGQDEGEDEGQDGGQDEGQDKDQSEENASKNNEMQIDVQNDKNDIHNIHNIQNGQIDQTQDTVATDASGFFEDVAQAAVSSFETLKLSRPVLKGIQKAHYTVPTPIQASVIPVALMGRDIVAGAVTGSGKTAAYMIPTLERLLYRSQRAPATRVVVLTPTRELAMQVADVSKSLGSYISNLRFGLAVGGLNLRAQELELKTRPDVVVATPGRFIDHVRNSPSFSVDQVEILIVDEADRMLDEGFEDELNEILSLIPSKRQTLLFSATMNSSVKNLVKLSLHKPVRILINPPKQVATGLAQEFVRIRKHEESRPAILVSLLKSLDRNQRVIVFVTRKQTAHRLRIILGLQKIRVGELHGALTQEQRTASVQAFKSLEVPILICTDLASRGLDIPKIELVINYELPATYEVYMHRVGRTARAGRRGTSISLVGESTTERQVVRSAIQASAGSTTAEKQKILGRDIDWNQINAIKKSIDDMHDTISQVLSEEKVAKELAIAERDVAKAENLLLRKDEITSRPKRTWFESKDKPQTRAQKVVPKTNHQKKKADAGKAAWGYSKTKSDRSLNSKRGAGRAIDKAGKRKAKRMVK